MVSFCQTASTSVSGTDLHISYNALNKNLSECDLQLSGDKLAGSEYPEPWINDLEDNESKDDNQSTVNIIGNTEFKNQPEKRSNKPNYLVYQI